MQKIIKLLSIYFLFILFCLSNGSRASVFQDINSAAQLDENGISHDRLKSILNAKTPSQQKLSSFFDLFKTESGNFLEDFIYDHRRPILVRDSLMARYYDEIDDPYNVDWRLGSIYFVVKKLNRSVYDLKMNSAYYLSYTSYLNFSLEQKKPKAAQFGEKEISELIAQVDLVQSSLKALKIELASIEQNSLDSAPIILNWELYKAETYAYYEEKAKNTQYHKSEYWEFDRRASKWKTMEAIPAQKVVNQYPMDSFHGVTYLHEKGLRGKGVDIGVLEMNSLFLEHIDGNKLIDLTHPRLKNNLRFISGQSDQTFHSRLVTMNLGAFVRAHHERPGVASLATIWLDASRDSEKFNQALVFFRKCIEQKIPIISFSGFTTIDITPWH